MDPTTHDHHSVKCMVCPATFATVADSRGHKHMQPGWFERSETGVVKPTIHKLPSTEEGVRAARDLPDAANGDIFYVPSEGVVGAVHRGVAFAFTTAHGHFTPVTALRSVEAVRHPYRASFETVCRMAVIVDRVERGARWFDTHYPLWFVSPILSIIEDEIDGWDIVYAASRGSADWRELDDANGAMWLVLRGFSARDIGKYGPEYDYLALSEAWRDLITARWSRNVADDGISLRSPLRSVYGEDDESAARNA